MISSYLVDFPISRATLQLLLLYFIVLLISKRVREAEVIIKAAITSSTGENFLWVLDLLSFEVLNEESFYIS